MSKSNFAKVVELVVLESLLCAHLLCAMTATRAKKKIAAFIVELVMMWYLGFADHVKIEGFNMIIPKKEQSFLQRHAGLITLSLVGLAVWWWFNEPSLIHYPLTHSHLRIR